MKRLSLVLASLGLSVSALAAFPAATDPSLVNVPCLQGGFFIGGTALYLKPSDSNGDLDFARVDSPVANTTNQFTSHIDNVEPDYNWAWGVNVGYIIPGTGNDVNLSYFNLDASQTEGLAYPLNSPTGIFPVNGGLLGGAYNSAHSQVDLNINQVDLVVGQYIDVGCRLILHPNVGMRWTSLTRKLTDIYGVINDAGQVDAFTNEVTDNSDFQGLGPLLGLDVSYYLGMGFGAVAHFDGATLIGNINDKQSVYFIDNTVSPSVIEIQHISKTDDGARRIVPVVDAKLGLDYTVLLHDASNSDVTVEAGWQFSKYYNAVDRLVTTTGLTTQQGAGDPVLAGSIAGHKTSNVGLSGPYISIVFHA